MAALRIIAMSTLAAVCYGVVHDQITARVCVEYFTIGHPRILTTDSPTLLGIAWGILATWWVGVGLGIVLASASRIGKRPARAPVSLVRPIALLMVVTAVCALAAGILGYALAREGAVLLLEPLASRIPAERHAVFLADLWAHSASYLVGGLGAVVLAVRIWRGRGRVLSETGQSLRVSDD